MSQRPPSGPPRRLALMVGRALAVAVVAWLAAPATAQEADGVTPARVLVVVGPAGGGTPAVPAQTVADTVQLELVANGLQPLVRLVSATPPIATLHERELAAWIEAQGPFARARHLILVSYSVDSERLSLDALWYDLAARRIVTRASGGGPVDIFMDLLITRVVDRLLGGAQTLVAALTAADTRADRDRTAQPANGAVAAATTTEANGVAATDTSAGTSSGAEVGTRPATPAATTEAGATNSAAEETAAAEGPVTEADPEQPRSARGHVQPPPSPPRRIATAVAGGPFLPIALSSSTINIAMLTTLAVEYRMPLGAGQLGLGIETGWYGFSLSGAIASAESSLVPIDALVSYLSASGTPVTFSATASLGTAVFNINPNQAGVLRKMILHLGGGLGVQWNITPRFATGLTLRYHAFLEESQAITGFVPSLGLALAF